MDNMQQKIISKRKGSFLEVVIEKLFGYAGFKTILNPKYTTQLLDKKEIDIEASYLGKKILISCKQYEEAKIPVSDLILQCTTLKKILNADIFIQILWGYTEKREKDIALANNSGIIIWNDKDIIYLLDLVFQKREDVKAQILLSLGIDTKEARDYTKIMIEEYHKNIKELIILMNKALIDNKYEMAFADFENYNTPMYFKTTKYFVLDYDSALAKWLSDIIITHKPYVYELLTNFFKKTNIYFEFCPDFNEIYILKKIADFGTRIEEKNPEKWWFHYRKYVIERIKNIKN